MRLICSEKHASVYLSTDSFGDLILTVIDSALEEAVVCEVFPEGGWPLDTEAVSKRLLKEYLNKEL